MRKLPYTSMFSGKSHDGAIELSEKLKEIAPVPGLQDPLRLRRLRSQ